MLSLLFPLVMCASGVSSQSPVVREQVDLIEVNHFHDDTARLVLDQVIFYQWSATQRRFVVRAWRMIRHPHQLPHQVPNGDGYECLWRDDQVMRCVTAPVMRETWTQIDPERANRQYLPQDERVDLAQVTSASKRSR